MKFGIEYYYCLGINLVYIVYFTIGFLLTDRQKKTFQFIVLITFPILIYTFFTFTGWGFTTGYGLLGVLVIFIILVFISRSLEIYMLDFVPYRIENQWWYKTLYFILDSISLFGVPIFGFAVLYIITNWIITLIVFGILMILFLIIFLRTYEDFLNWAYPLLGRFDLLVIILLLGYFGWSVIPVNANFTTITVFFFIIIHYIVDSRKSKGLIHDFSPHFGKNKIVIGHYSYESYRGASPVPLGFALVAATSFTTLHFLKSTIIIWIWIAFGLVCYYLLRNALYYYLEDRRDGYTFNRKRVLKYLGLILLTIIVVSVLPFLIGEEMGVN